MSSVSDEERRIVVLNIASILDYRSVYMGGPSRNNINRAEKIVDMLEKSKRLVASTCDHSAYKDYKSNGIYCPTCDMKIMKALGETDGNS